MDEQRLEQYVLLIQELLRCPGGQEGAVLQAHAELVDAGLLLVIPQVTQQLQKQGNAEAAEWLIHLGLQLAEALEGSRNDIEQPSGGSLENSLRFLAEVLQLTAQSQGDAKQVYSFLAAHQTQLNEEMLQALLMALEVFSQGEVERRQFVAMIIGEFGNIIQQFPLGSRWLNLELAITAYKIILNVFERGQAPKLWAVIQNNLAAAYYSRIRGDRADNIEQAITAYQLALQVRTREAFPDDWAMTQNNLATAYSDRIRGDRADNIEQAITAFQLALQVRTREAFPEQWATTQNNLATAYSDRIRGDRADNIEQAITAFQLALQVRMPETLPIDCLQTGRNLGNTAFTASRWQDAITGYSTAIEAVERLRSWAADEDRRQEIQEQAIEVYEKMVQACVNTRQFAKAVEVAERSRSKRLVELIATNDLYHSGNIPPEIAPYLQQYEAVQEEINKLRFGRSHNDENRTLASAAPGTRGRAALDAATQQIQELETQKHAIRQQLSRLDPVSAGLLQVSAPNLAAMERLVDSPTTTLLSFYTTSTDTHIFVLRQDELTCHTCSGQNVETLQQWLIDQWLRPYLEINQADDPEECNERRKNWAEQMPEVLQGLAQRLQLNSLIETHLQGATELIVVPHLFLHQIPFAALPTPEGFLGDRFQLRVVPSCQVLEFCQQRPPIAFDSIQHSTVEDATEDLPCSSFEGEAIAKLYNIPAAQRLRGRDQAKVENYRQLAQQSQVILSSHHAQSRLDNPLESMLVLADGAITLGQLLTPAWRLPHLSDVFLSCCETGIGFTSATFDEPLSLATGFLCAGARSVVSTLWAVDDLATALFSIHYHQHRRSLNCPEAVQRAQQDLRQMTGADLAQRYKQPLLTLLDQKYEAAEAKRQQAEAQMGQYNPQSDDYQNRKRDHDLWARSATQIEDTQTRLKKLCRTQLPFAHSIYWAAFITQGLR
ncbi:CHAT domain-containing protein [Trichocoleus sp. FACHB-591]|uniref:CHAT domain-containing protein n=1 Tax=Trichocoleus sp. FACHB-591 TaxID=2692872 RepID=UPI001689AB97|nr:CHAT domain-containing tetratricopeptide repeat protein [Trichocoleus sp. FACHB-591]MBD2094455.1 CHAT domain-containing protein [Trichocoleus sp. FACHB-591]